MARAWHCYLQNASDPFSKVYKQTRATQHSPHAPPPHSSVAAHPKRLPAKKGRARRQGRARASGTDHYRRNSPQGGYQTFRGPNQLHAADMEPWPTLGKEPSLAAPCPCGNRRTTTSSNHI